MDIEQLRVIAYVIVSGILVVVLYGYIVYLYRSEKQGVKDYEKLGKIAIDDEVESEPINTSNTEPSQIKEQKQ